jgi:demethylmenaquinone methyltransferase/2-methoxy-6-polyprenyl-1,4-benzoquinol methylase
VTTASEIRSLFARVASRYDFFNHALSGGLDFYWRARLMRAVRKLRPASLLDLATGSGDVIRCLQRGRAVPGLLCGADFCEPMLRVARRKTAVPLLAADALALPFTDNSWSAITIAFGFRNFTDRARALREIRRVLRPGGVLFILEFSRPSAWLLPFYRFFLHHVVPRLVALLAPTRAAYEYLGSSIEAFPQQTQLAAQLREAGFPYVHWTNLSCGIVALHCAHKSEN